MDGDADGEDIACFVMGNDSSVGRVDEDEDDVLFDNCLGVDGTDAKIGYACNCA